MENLTKELDALLGLSKYRVISITGGGGKTSLMFALGRYFDKSGLTVITTTTKIFPPEKDGALVCVTAPAPVLKKMIAEGGFLSHLIVATKEKMGEKLSGYSTEEIALLSLEPGLARMVIEADGSKGLSLKAYEKWEPPVPACTDCQLVVLGADIFTRPLSPSNTFRLDMLKERFSLPPCGAITPESCAEILSDSRGYLKNSPEKAIRILFINKCDLLSKQELGKISAILPPLLRGYDHVVLGSLRAGKLYGKADITR